jgi:hypothetical protein
MNLADDWRLVLREELKRYSINTPKDPVIGSAEYMKALSGYKQKTAIAKWCRKNGIKFLRNGGLV